MNVVANFDRFNWKYGLTLDVYKNYKAKSFPSSLILIVVKRTSKMFKLYFSFLFEFALLATTLAGGQSEEEKISWPSESSFSIYSESSKPPVGIVRPSVSCVPATGSKPRLTSSPSQEECTACSGLFTISPSNCGCVARDGFMKFKLVYDDPPMNDYETCCTSSPADISKTDKFDKIGWIPKGNEINQNTIGSFIPYWNRKNSFA